MNKVVEIQHDGFDASEHKRRTIQGYRINYSTEGHWLCQGLPAKDIEYLAVDTTVNIQRWQGGAVVPEEEYFPPLPDIDKLNAAVPRSEWEAGYDGNPKPPYAKNSIIYLLDPVTGEKFTIIGASIGLRICRDLLIDAVQTMRKLRGVVVVPVVRLASAPMKTRFCARSRPHLAIVRWVSFGPSGITAEEQPRLASPTVKEPKPVAEPTAGELIDDGLEDFYR
jgi:hypothetical protein